MTGRKVANMTHGGRKAKARRLQVEVAEMLARAFGLTILAEKPTKPGRRNGVLWVPEGEPADLKVRMMGQSGADVALLTARARRAVAYDGAPLWIECKNMEAGWELGKAFWSRKVPGGIAAAWRQAQKGAVAVGRVLGVMDRGMLPLVVLSRNFWPPVAVAHSWLIERPWPGPLVVLKLGNTTSLDMRLLEDMILLLDGGIANGGRK